MSGNKQLLKAIASESKLLTKQMKFQKERSFIKAHWNIFAGSRAEVIKACEEAVGDSGQAVLDQLGLKNVFIKQISESKMRNACYNMTDSDVFKAFKQMQSRCQELTVFFISHNYDRDYVICLTNQHCLESPGEFMHRLDSGADAPDIYWASEKSKAFAELNLVGILPEESIRENSREEATQEDSCVLRAWDDTYL